MDQILQLKGRDLPVSRSNYFPLQEIHFKYKDKKNLKIKG